MELSIYDIEKPKALVGKVKIHKDVCDRLFKKLKITKIFVDVNTNSTKRQDPFVYVNDQKKFLKNIIAGLDSEEDFQSYYISTEDGDPWNLFKTNLIITPKNNINKDYIVAAKKIKAMEIKDLIKYIRMMIDELENRINKETS